MILRCWKILREGKKIARARLRNPRVEKLENPGEKGTRTSFLVWIPSREGLLLLHTNFNILLRDGVPRGLDPLGHGGLRDGEQPTWPRFAGRGRTSKQCGNTSYGASLYWAIGVGPDKKMELSLAYSACPPPLPTWPENLPYRGKFTLVKNLCDRGT